MLVSNPRQAHIEILMNVPRYEFHLNLLRCTVKADFSVDMKLKGKETDFANFQGEERRREIKREGRKEEKRGGETRNEGRKEGRSLEVK